MFVLKKEGEIPFYAPFTEHAFCRAAITTRAGGVSKGHFASLNFSTSCGDSPENVQENLRRLAEAFGFLPEKLVRTNQLHTDRVLCVSKADAGNTNTDARFTEGVDAIITNEVNVPLLATFADCVPILFCDPVQKAVGVCHSGWRGTVSKIAEKTVLEMQKAFGSRPRDIHAAIGPHIGACCFLVDTPVYAEFKAAFSSADSFCRKESEKYAIDLSAAVRDTLCAAGVQKISDINICTSCESETFFSHRKTGGKRGCFSAVIWKTEA